MNMGWSYNTNKPLPVVKHDGECLRKAMWRYCPYWVAKTVGKKTIGFRCTLFDADKADNAPRASLPECNAKYGTSYDGNP
jgi:hypothetical protein